MKRYSASVVGGGVGGRLSMAALEASGRYDLIAATDLRPEVCEALRSDYPQLQTFTSHVEMFTACPTDVVCVSTYPPTHRNVTIDALERLPLKGMLVEKPLGDTAAAGREILDRIRERNLPLAVPHGLLVAPHAREIIERVRSGEIGDLKLVEIQCREWDIINAGIHWLNFFVMLTGNEPMRSVLAACDTTSRTWRDGMQVETIAVTYVQSQSGIRAVMETGDYVRVNREGKGTLFRLIGTGGTIEFWGWESAYRIVNAKHPDGKLIEVPAGEAQGHQRHLDALAEQIDAGTPDYSVPDSSLAALELCEGAYLSSAHRCQVTLPLADFTPPEPNDWQPGQPYSGTGGGRDGRKLE